MRHILLVESEAGAFLIQASFRARLQHRVADRGADRRPIDVDDHRHRRLEDVNRTDLPNSSTSWSRWSSDLTEGNHIERELMLVKVRASGKDRDDEAAADIFRDASSMSPTSYTIELTRRAQARRIHQSIEPGVILETVRTGASGIGRLMERILRI
jgi:hypothetical protein